MAHILVIDDEPGIIDTLTYALTSEGHEVTSRATAGEGLAALEDSSIDLVLLDVGLPDGSGFELCTKLRQLGSLPIIFLTARSSEIDRILGLELGGDDYVTKPFSPREVTARVKAVLRRTGSSSEPAAETGFVIDTHRRRITFCGQVLRLSRLEYRLLCVMIRRPGWVYSREQLMRLAWEDADASLERTVDTHIKTIRTKLRAVDSEANPIVTHRGIGYALADSC